MAISTLRCKNAQQNTQNKNISQTRTFRERKQPCFCNYIFCIVVVPIDNPTEFQLSMYHCIIVWSHVSSSLCVGRTISYTNCDSFATVEVQLQLGLSIFQICWLFLLLGKVKVETIICRVQLVFILNELTTLFNIQHRIHCRQVLGSESIHQSKSTFERQ